MLHADLAKKPSSMIAVASEEIAAPVNLRETPCSRGVVMQRVRRVVGRNNSADGNSRSPPSITFDNNDRRRPYPRRVPRGVAAPEVDMIISSKTAWKRERKCCASVKQISRRCVHYVFSEHIHVFQEIYRTCGKHSRVITRMLRLYDGGPNVRTRVYRRESLSHTMCEEKSAHSGFLRDF